MEPTEIALRGYIPLRKERKNILKSNVAYSSDDIVIVFDTETTTDAYQNLLFGSCGIWIAGYLYRFIIFYDEKLRRPKLKILKQFVNKTIEDVQIEIMNRREFIETVFYPWAYIARALCVGFNLPFDLSRIANTYGFAKNKFKNGFSFKLSQNTFYPRIRIKSLDSTKSFIEFNNPVYKGRFLDLRTLTFAMTNEKMTLETACKNFNTSVKKKSIKSHGKINKEYVKYNINDVLATYTLLSKMLERYQELKVSITPEKSYSPASLGKSYLNQMGITPFLEKNPDFSKKILGHIMTTFYGGRSEVRLRKKPTRVRYMDFSSMYPSVFALMELWNFLIANRIEFEDVTSEIRKLFSNLTIESVVKKEYWKEFVVIVQVKPDHNILPIRSHFDEKKVWNIGLCKVSSKETLWYTLPDVIASKLLTGKPPKILKAIQFKAKEIQKNLTDIDIIGDIKVTKKENLIQKLIECRRIKKKERDQYPESSPQHSRLEREQDTLKTIANAISYGIFIEINTEDEERKQDLYGLKHHKTKASKKETFGRYFHPILATMLTSGARLMIATAEAWLKEHRGFYTFCDTDGIAVSLKHWKKLQEFFEPLNPFNTSDTLLKLEKENYDDKGELVDLWFYGISAKRYVLYSLVRGKSDPVKWSLHGLGHLETEDGWEKEFWKNILRHAHGQIYTDELLSKYSNQYAVSKFRVSTAHVLNRIRALNKDKSYSNQVKPFNFLHVGQPATTNQKGESIHPITFYGDPKIAPYQPFVDYRTGKMYTEYSEMHWQTIHSSIENYMNHPESKFMNGQDTGKLYRRHVKTHKIRYIGKESNELEHTEMFGVDDDTYTRYHVRQLE